MNLNVDFINSFKFHTNKVRIEHNSGRFIFFFFFLVFFFVAKNSKRNLQTYVNKFVSLWIILLRFTFWPFSHKLTAYSVINLMKNIQMRWSFHFFSISGRLSILIMHVNYPKIFFTTLATLVLLLFAMFVLLINYNRFVVIAAKVLLLFWF